MKVKDLEGEPHEINNLLQQNNFSLSEYLSVKKEKKNVPAFALIIIGVLFFINACLVFIHTFSSPIHDILVLSLLIIAGFSVVIIHHNLENKMVTFLTACVFITIVSVSLGVTTPAQAIKDAAKASKDVSGKVLE